MVIEVKGEGGTSTDLEYHCPKCGKELQEYSTKLGGLCEKCFRDINKERLKPITIDAEICYNCGRVKIGGPWLDRKKLTGKIEKTVEKKLDVSVHCSLSREAYIQLLRERKLCIPYKADFKGISIGGSDVLLTVRPRLCQECRKKFTGKLNKAILRIRAPKKTEEKIQQVLKKIREIFYKEGRGENIDIKEVSNGIDVFLSSREIGDKIEGVLRSHFSAKVEAYSIKKKDETLNKTITVRKAKISL